ncbi:hypothetical protein QL285_029659 [Trifolium repens]|nr:hypothetical protein QL285_029659 [Trifolium repens]
MLKSVVEDMDLSKIIKTMVMASSQHRLVPLPCFAKCFTGPLGKYMNSDLGFHELIVWKELVEKFFLKYIPVGPNLSRLVQVPIFRFPGQ